MARPLPLEGPVDAALPPPASLPADWSVRPAATSRDWVDFEASTAAGFDEPDVPGMAELGEATRGVHYPAHAYASFLGRSGAEVVSVASTITLPDVPVALVNDVCTLPGFRRRGLAAVLVTHALRALAPGPRAAVLTATPAAQGVYTRLGFAPVPGLAFALCIRTPEGTPAAAPSPGVALPK